MNVTIAIFLERSIELLAFYLILANINGKDVKTAFTELVVTKQKILLGNIVLLVAYPLGMSLLIQFLRRDEFNMFGLLVNLLLSPFVVYFLLRLRFNLKKFLLTNILSFVIAIVCGMIILISAANPFFAFILTFATITLLTTKNYFEHIYLRLIRKQWLLNLVLTISLLVYFMPFFIEGYSIIFVLFLSSGLIWIIFFQIHKAGKIIIGRLKNATTSDFLFILSELATEHQQSEIMHQYIIKTPFLLEITSPLIKALKLQKMVGAINDYEFTINKQQIKINVIL